MNTLHRTTILFLLGLTVAVPALAQDGTALHPRLVAGGADLAMGDRRVELLSTPNLSVGTLSPLGFGQNGIVPPLPPATTQGTMLDKLAMGGYVTYSQEAYSLSSVLRNRETSAGTNVSASYAGLLGEKSTTALTLGYDWRRNTGLLANPQPFDMTNPGLSLALSWNHALSPNLFFGGFAAAQHTAAQPEEMLTQPGNSYRLGAGLGLKF